MGTQYCTAGNVESNLKGVTFSVSTTPSISEVEQFIVEESAVIDTHIKSRYALPVTGSDALEFLRKICIDLSVYRVTKLLQPRNQQTLSDDSDQDISHASAHSKAMTLLRKINRGDLALPSEGVESKTFIRSSQRENNRTKVFDLDTKQW